MISAVIKGGLANQMFIIAATHALALNNNDECVFDMDIKRKYYGVVHQGRVASMYFGSLYRTVKQAPLKWTPRSYYKADDNAPYKPIPYSPNMLIEGYFQSEKYFVEKKDDIVKLFIDERLRNGLGSKFANYLNNSLSIHIRKGDYARFPMVYPILDMEYYNKALVYMREHTQVENILIFSDSISWCKENFQQEKLIFVEGLEDWEDMYLMSLCSNHIIANSSFSWWGAYLNPRQEKIIIAPKQWMCESTKFYWRDVYTDKMIIIPNNETIT